MFWIQLNHNLCCYHPQTWLSTSFHLSHHLTQVIDASTPKLHHLKVYWAQRLSSSLRISRSSRTPPPSPFVAVAVRFKTTAISEGRSHRRKPAAPSSKSSPSLSKDPEESSKIERPWRVPEDRASSLCVVFVVHEDPPSSLYRSSAYAPKTCRLRTIEQTIAREAVAFVALKSNAAAATFVVVVRSLVPSTSDLFQETAVHKLVLFSPRTKRSDQASPRS